MIPLLDTSDTLEDCETEIGIPCGELITPLTRRKPKRAKGIFAIDNGAFSKFNANDFRSLLERERERSEFCKFVTAPDVVGSAIRTLECFARWREELAGFPVALVLQDGQESLPIPWDEIDAIFVGGSTEWKMGKHAADCIRAGKILGKWVHAGRVNTPGRFEYFEKLGVDSIDGTGMSRFSWMRNKIYHSAREPELNME